jgi:hypothetical protein
MKKPLTLAITLAFITLLPGCGKEEAKSKTEIHIAEPKEAPESKPHAATPQTLSTPETLEHGIVSVQPQHAVELHIRESLDDAGRLLHELEAMGEDVKKLESRKVALEKELQTLSKQ